jgi:hypothetical protein
VLYISAILYSLNYWLARAFLVRDPLTHTNWPFILGLNLILILSIVWTTAHSKARAYFGVNNEQKL